MRSLISEISRIREMMNLPNNLLTESIGIPPNIIELLQRLLTGNDPDFTFGTLRVPRTDLTNLVQKLESPDFTIANLTSNEKTIIGNVIGSDRDVSKKFYIKYIEQEIGLGRGKNEIDVLKKIMESAQKKENQNKSLDEVIDNYFRGITNKELIIPAIKPTLIKQWETLRTDPNNFVTVLTDVATRRLTPEQKNKITTVINRKSPGLFVGDFFIYYKKSIDDIKTTIYEYNNGYIQEINAIQIQNSRSENPLSPADLNKKLEPVKQAYAAKITTLMNQLETRLNGSAAEILESYRLDSTITTLIRDGEIKFFVIFREIWKKEGESLTEMIKETNISFINEFVSTLKGLTKRDEFWNSLKSIFDPRTSIGQFMMTAQFASLNKQYLALIRTSARENPINFARFKTLYIAQSFVGYYLGWMLTEAIFWLKELLVAILYEPYIVVTHEIENLYFKCFGGSIDITWDEPDNVFKDSTEWDRIKGYFSGVFKAFDLYDENESTRQNLADAGLLTIQTVVYIIAKLVPGGFGTLSESYDWAIIDKIWFEAKDGKWSPNMMIEKIGKYLSDMWGSLTGTAVVTAYSDDLESFKNFLTDKEMGNEYNIEDSKIEEDEDGKWYVAIGKETSNKYYQFKENKFEEGQ